MVITMYNEQLIKKYECIFSINLQSFAILILRVKTYYSTKRGPKSYMYHKDLEKQGYPRDWFLLVTVIPF